MSSKVDVCFVQPLVRFFKSCPYGPDFAQKLEPFASDLNEDTLEAAANRLMETAKSFPNLTTCRKALKEAERQVLARPSTEMREWDFKARDKAAWQARLDAIRLIRTSDLGHEANRDGWLAALIDFATDHHRLPGPGEESRCIAQAARSRKALEDCRGTGLYRSLSEMRQAMLARAFVDVFGHADAPAMPDIR
jgi:hypothetical protein